MNNKNSTGKTGADQRDGAGDFESALGELKRIVSELESGDLSLTDSLDRYEMGIRRLKQCHEHLEAAELRVSQLVAFDADGNPVLESIGGEESDDLAEKQKTRQRRRTATGVAQQPDSGAAAVKPRVGRPASKDSIDDLPELF